MDAVAATEFVENRARALSAQEFELLCESVLTETLPPATFSVTPFRQDGGIDIDGSVRTPLVDVSLGVQVKQYAPSSTVGSPEIQRFQGALHETGHDTGTVVTASSFSTPAIDSAEHAGIHLVDGRALFETMVEYGIGVRHVGEAYEPHDAFWSLFDEPDRTDVVTTKRVPLANSFDTLDAVLAAVGSSRGTRDGIVAVAGVSPRHADLYAIAGWILGFLHQEWPDDDDEETQRRWSLTRSGARYNAYRRSGLEAEAAELLHEGIRNAAIVARVRDELASERRIDHSSLVDIVEQESELSSSSARRRGSTVGSWLGRLPEVTVETGGGKVYYWDP